MKPSILNLLTFIVGLLIAYWLTVQDLKNEMRIKEIEIRVDSIVQNPAKAEKEK